MNYINNITEAIGHTPLLKLNRVGKDAGANVFVKLEHLNPSGSYKDRMALAMVEAAERGDTWNGKKLDEGGTVVEASAGNTAPAVAMVCAAKGYKAKIFLYRYRQKEDSYLPFFPEQRLLYCPPISSSVSHIQQDHLKLPCPYY